MKKALLIGALTLCTSMSFANAETLKFGTEATFAPFEFTDNKANIIGYDVDIIKAIGEAEGFDVQVVNMPFDSLIPGVLTAQLDGVFLLQKNVQSRYLSLILTTNLVSALL